MPFRRAGLALVVALVAVNLTTLVGAGRAPAATAPGTPGISIVPTSYPVPDGALFVAPTGKDSNPGTQDAPLRTGAAAVAKAVAGRMTTVVFREGEYRERLGDVSAPVTLQPYPGERVWFKGSAEIPAGQLVADGNAWRLDGWNPASVCRASGPAYDECMNPVQFNDDNPVGGDPQMVFVDGEPMRQVATREEVRAGTFFHDGAADRTYLGSDPTGRKVELTAKKSALHLFAGADGSVVRGLGFEHYGSSQNEAREPAAVVVQAGGVVVEKNTIARNAATGLLVNADDAHVNGNLVAENGYDGVIGHRSANLVVEGNRVLRNNTEALGQKDGYNLGGAGVKGTRLINAKVRDNVFEANQGNGFWCEISCYDVTVVRNLMRANSHHGLHYKVSGAALLASNVLADNGMTGLNVMGSNHVQVYNNTAVGNGQAIAVLEDPRPVCPGDVDDCPTDADRALGITWDTADTTLVNNVLVGGTGTAPLMSTVDYNKAESGRRVGADGMIPAPQMHHNGYARGDADPATPLVQWAKVAGTSPKYASLAEFQTVTGRDTSSRYQDAGYLVNAAGGDYRLVPASPAETAGAALPTDVAAAIGVPATNPTRLGALTWPVEPVTTELIRQGDGTVPWWSAGNPALAVDGGALRATVADGAANPPDAVVLQRTAALVGGRTYTLSFDAWATQDVSIQAVVQEGDEPHSTSLTQQVDLEADVQHFSFPFTSTVDTTAAEVVFQLGGQGAFTGYLGNVSLVADTWTVAAEPKASEEDALAAAATSGQLVEVLSERGEAREVYATPDGGFTSEEHFQPVRTIVNGTWVPIDTTLRKQPDGSIAPVAGSVRIRLSGGGTDPMVTMDQSGRPISLTWPTPLPAPRLDGSAAVYPGVLGPDVDLRVQVEPAGFAHVLVVRTAAAAKDPRLASLKLGLTAPGLTVSTAEDGTQQAVDQTTGAVVYQAPVPVMWDSASATAPLARAVGSPAEEAMDEDAVAEASDRQPGDASKVEAVATSVDNGDLVLRPNAAMLASADTKFPVYIDPMWDTPRASARLMVSSGGWSKYNFKKDEGMGQCPRNYPPAGAYCGGAYEKRLFYRIPTARFAHKQIISAEFHVREVWATSCRKKLVDIYLATAFGAGSTWNSTKDNWKRRLDSRNVAKGFGSGCPAGDVLFDVASGIRESASKGAADTTFGLRARDNDDQLAWKRFDRKAFVRVHYNSPPPQPKMNQLSSSPGGACRGPDSPARFNRVPVLYAKNLTDLDNKGVEGEKLKAQFQVSWVDGGGVRRTRNLGTVKKMSAGKGRASSFSVKANGIPQGVTVSWEVRAYDGRAWSPWSSAGNATACYFVYDARALPDPTITSNAADGYPAHDPDDPNQVATDGVGRYGKFTIAFDARVAKYAYAMNTNPSEGAAKTRTAATETIQAMPTHEGLNSLYVTAWDGSNNWSTGTYEFWVAPGRAPRAQWTFDEPAGAGQLADSAPKAPGQASYPATPHGGATLGANGAVGTSMTLNGTSGYAATAGPVLDTAKNFAVSAWVRLPATLPTTQTVVVSQAGTQMAGFYLKFDSNDRKWKLWRTQADGNTAGAGTAISLNTAQGGVWTHLVGIQDVVANKLRIFVNGVEGTPAELGPLWSANGSLLIGRGLYKGVAGDYLAGNVDDVRVFDRLVTADEVRELFTVKPVAMGAWHLNAATGTPLTSPDGVEGGKHALTLNGAAKITTDATRVLVESPAGTPSGALALPGGDNDYASATGALLDPRESFTISAWVATPGTPTRSMTVLSLPGTYNSAITVRYDPAKRRYVLDVPSKDGTGATVANVEHSSFHQGNYGDWDHIAVTYDATEDTVTLWVNGVREVAAGAETLSLRHHTKPFGPIASMQLGRGLAGGAYPAGRNWAGLVDDVWVLRGVASRQLIDALALPTELGSISR